MKEEQAILLLQNKAKQLDRLPKRSDFSNEEVCLIKAKLGPWNRALERAGLKEVSLHYLAKKQKVKEKRELKRKINE